MASPRDRHHSRSRHHSRGRERDSRSSKAHTRTHTTSPTPMSTTTSTPTERERQRERERRERERTPTPEIPILDRPLRAGRRDGGGGGREGGGGKPDINGFLELLGDVLRLPDETLTMTHIYLNRYRKWFTSAVDSQSPDLPSSAFQPGGKLLDDHTLSLACLSLSTKSMEAPRRIRDILLPAYRLLHPPPYYPPLTYPSHLYDSLRQTLVQAELILLRALGFAIYTPLAYEYLPRIVSRVLDTKVYGDGGIEEWEGYSVSEAEECGVVRVQDSGLGKRARVWVGKAAREYRIAGWYTMRTVAAVSVWLGMWEVGWEVDCGGGGGGGGGGSGRSREPSDTSEKRRSAISEWVTGISSGRVDPEEFWEVVDILEPRAIPGERGDQQFGRGGTEFLVP